MGFPAAFESPKRADTGKSQCLPFLFPHHFCHKYWETRKIFRALLFPPGPVTLKSKTSENCTVFPEDQCDAHVTALFAVPGTPDYVFRECQLTTDVYAGDPYPGILGSGS